jgi:hypothetical protein
MNQKSNFEREGREWETTTSRKKNEQRTIAFVILYSFALTFFQTSHFMSHLASSMWTQCVSIMSSKHFLLEFHQETKHQTIKDISLHPSLLLLLLLLLIIINFKQ